MEQVINRTFRAKTQAQRQFRKLKERNAAASEYTRRQQNQRRLRRLGSDIKAARETRREDWALGALAPRRDVGEKAEKYGTMELYDMQAVQLPPKERLKWWPVVKGDRVVVVRGREKGRIGMIWRTDAKKNTVEVNDINVVDFFVPEWMPRPPGDERKIVAHSQAMHVNDVRLVYPLPDPETGVPKDVVIEKLLPVNLKRTRGRMGMSIGERVIAGTNTIIPWPEKPDEEYEDHEDDTLRITVEEQTFRPVLLHPPMPMSVIDELRNKYSKFRTRHDYEYLEKKREIDARHEARKELPKTMRTPLQELADLRARQKAATERELSDEQLAKIGEVIAAEREKATDAVKKLKI